MAVEAEDTRREAEAATRQVAEDIRQVAADTRRAAADTNKFQSDTQDLKALTSIKNCCTRSRKFFFNKRTWEAAAEEDMAGTREDMVVVSHRLTEHLKAATDLLDIVQVALLVSISGMSFRVTKSLSS